LRAVFFEVIKIEQFSTLVLLTHSPHVEPLGYPKAPPFGVDDLGYLRIQGHHPQEVQRLFE
jgi:hypothetical protein